MTVAMIAAVARNGVIGDGSRMPWHLPEDAQGPGAGPVRLGDAVGEDTVEKVEILAHALHANTHRRPPMECDLDHT